MTREWLKKVHASALCDIETLEATYDLCRAAIYRGVVGDFVECGVYAGAHPAVMGKAILDSLVGRAVAPASNSNRRVHLLDTFSGIPQAGPNDEEFLSSGVPANHSACSLEQVKANLEAWNLPAWIFLFHVGLFQQTTASLEAPDRIAVLRLDGDLYSSTADCIDNLLPLVSRGGWVIVDDLNLSGCRKAVLERVVPAPIYWRVPTK